MLAIWHRTSSIAQSDINETHHALIILHSTYQYNILPTAPKWFKRSERSVGLATVGLAAVSLGDASLGTSQGVMWVTRCNITPQFVYWREVFHTIAFRHYPQTRTYPRYSVDTVFLKLPCPRGASQLSTEILSKSHLVTYTPIQRTLLYIKSMYDPKYFHLVNKQSLNPLNTVTCLLWMDDMHGMKRQSTVQNLYHQLFLQVLLANDFRLQ